MMGSFDAGYGTWYLEDLVGKKLAKEIWFRNPKISAQEALAMGLINKVVPDAELKAATRAFALEISERGSFALASVKGRVQRAPWRRLGPVAHGARPAAAQLPRRATKQGAVEGVRRQAQALIPSKFGK
jgi:enoyl-CoA hydratase/carnithine racemase